MKALWIIGIILIIGLLAAPAAAQVVSLKEGTTKGSASEVYLSAGSVQFSTSGTSALSYMIVDGKRFTPTNTILSSGTLTWKNGDSNVQTSYKYEANSLKETITINKDMEIQFPITVDENSKLIPWFNGQWKIVSKTSGDTMTGIVLEKPFGIDQDGNRVPMEYTYTDNKLNLVYNKFITTYNNQIPTYSAIRYPLVVDPSFVATGGCWTAIDGVYTIVKWNATGSSTWTPPVFVSSVQYLVVAGGGGGGANNGGGGGGAGGLLTGTYTLLPGNQNITVGAGGLGGGGADAGGFSGSNSTFGNLTTTTGGLIAMGGGGAGSSASIGKTGGSGGGGKSSAGGSSLGGAGIVGQGHDGGDGEAAAWSSGGGGGSTNDGGDGAASVSGAGGPGTTSTITGESIVYAAGGGGGDFDGAGGAGGSGGVGGAGSTVAGAAGNGAESTGSGGGGAGSAVNPGFGSAGVVIVRYLTHGEAQENPTSTIQFIPSSKFIGNSSNRYQNMTVYVQNLTFVDTIWINVTHPRLWINATNFFANLTDFSDSTVTVNNIFYNNTTQGTGSNNGFILVNLTKLNFNTTGTKPYSLGNIQYYLENVSCTNTTLPISYVVSGTAVPPVTTGFNVSLNYTGIRNFTFKDNGVLTLLPQYGLNLTYKNSETLSIITDAEVSASWSMPGTGDIYSGSNTTHVGLMDLFTPAGVITISSSAGGYKSSVNIFSTPVTPGPNIIYLVPEASERLVSPMYAKEIHFTLTNIHNVPIINASFVVTPVNSTLTNTNWLNVLIGIPSEATSMNDTVMRGMTDSAGSIVFPMVSSQQYRLEIDAAAQGVHETRWLYPIEVSYTIIVASSATSGIHAQLTDCVNATLYSADEGTNVWINLSYNDTCQQTANTTFYIDYPNRTRLYTQTFNGTVCSSCSPTTNQSFITGLLVPNVKWQSYVSGYTVNNTAFGNLSAAQGITLKGIDQVLINFFDPTCVNWGCT